MDPPEHTRLRTIIAREFSSRRVELLRPRIRDIAAALLDEIDPDTSADLMKTFALPLPLRVICELLGIPVEDAPRIADWSERLTTADLEGSDRAWSIADDIHAYLLALAERKRAVPDRSLFAGLVAAHDAGELTENELTAMAFLLVSAGHDFRQSHRQRRARAAAQAVTVGGPRRGARSRARLSTSAVPRESASRWPPRVSR
jgi:cytochrome P450